MADFIQQLEEFLASLPKNQQLSNEQLAKLDFFSMKGFEEGKALEKDLKYSDATRIYSLIMEIFTVSGKPFDKEYLFRRGFAYAELKLTDKAMADYEEFLKFMPKDPMTNNNIALLCCIKGDHAKEFEYFEKSIGSDPKYSLPRRNMAICYKNRGMLQEALKEIELAIQLNESDSYAYSVKGEIFEKMQKTDEAIKNYEKAVQLNPSDGFSANKLKFYKVGVSDNPDLTVFTVEKPTLTFNDLVGLDELKAWSKTHLLMPLSNKELASKYRKSFGGGMLLYGPPGCGKTYFCSALAGEAKIGFIKVKLSGVFDKWLGNTEKNIHNMFETARRNKPCILFIDELDGLGGKRGEGGNKYADQAVNQMLMELSELEEKKEEILVIGATNAPWSVDDAMKRSGRLGRFVYIPGPATPQRDSLFRKYLSAVPAQAKINYKSLAKKTEHFSVTDIKSICDEASGKAFEEAFRLNKTVPVTMKMLEAALRKEKSDLLEWYNTAIKLIGEAEMKEFYPDLYYDIVKVRKGTKSGLGDNEEMFR